MRIVSRYAIDGQTVNLHTLLVELTPAEKLAVLDLLIVTLKKDAAAGRRLPPPVSAPEREEWDALMKRYR
jgi:hypothetical protein